MTNLVAVDDGDTVEERVSNGVVIRYIARASKASSFYIPSELVRHGCDDG